MNELILQDLDMQALAMAVARNNVGSQEPLQVILAREMVTMEAYEKIKRDGIFIAYVDKFESEFIANGFSFMAKNKVAAEDGIKDMYQLLKDEDTPAAVKVKIYENFVTNAQLTPKNSSNAQGEENKGITINIVAPKGYTAIPVQDNPLPLKAKTKAADITEAVLVSEVDTDEDEGYYDAEMDEGYE